VRGLLGRRDFERAEAELAPLLKEYPQVGVVHALNGSLKLQQKDVAGARVEYERALSLTPNSIEALAGIIGVDLIQNRAPQARERIEARLAAEPKRVELLLMAGQVYGAQRDFAKAEATLRQAIQIDSTSSRAYSMLAGVLLASGKLDAARVEFDQMAQRDPRNVAAQTMAAMIVHSQNKTADAKKRYETIVNNDPTAAVAANNLAWIYQEENDRLDDALRLAQSAAVRLPDSGEVQDTIGMIYVKKALPALAVEAFEKCVEKHPENPLYHYHLALALKDSGNRQRARAAAEQAIKLRPDYPDAQKLLAETKG
jgi:tetratricopeptide (TPR) repeat protein